MTEISYVLRRKGVGLNLEGLEELSKTGLKVLSTENGSDNLPWDVKYVFRWGSTATIPGSGVVINRASAIHWAFDKRESRRILSLGGLAPKTWTDFGEFLDHFSGESFGKYVVRPATHKRSENLYLCQSFREVYEAISSGNSCWQDGYYISEYIKKDHEYRVWVVSGRIIAICEKIPTDKNLTSWGCVNQGQFKYIPWDQWPLEAAGKAVEAFRLSGLDFGAVDVMTLSTGLPSPQSYVLEINTAPEVTPYYLKCLTKAFDYIVKNGNQFIESDDVSWKTLIHPAISDMAKVDQNG